MKNAGMGLQPCGVEDDGWAHRILEGGRVVEGAGRYLIHVTRHKIAGAYIMSAAMYT